ncbi:glycosyltransferase [Loktanella sp. DJP18]|uniref:glycosyltransferase n=1 Tax=Loktanella sp. DJP18 TaxID=3409788 RepID=UPI003BB61056
MSAPSPDQPFGIVIAANNEEGYIGACLDALLAQDAAAGVMDVVVVANACTDRTEEIVAGHVSGFAARGWSLRCLQRAHPGKVGALNAGDGAVRGSLRAYLDADVVCAPALFGQLRAALAPDLPLYATGRLRVVPARSWITRQYARFWQRLPFVRSGAVGAGLFTVNAEGRRRWGAFPDIISDDTFVRLHFDSAERIEVEAPYDWPMIEGWPGLVRVRRRQDAGVREIHRNYPALIRNEGKAGMTRTDLARLAARDPVGFSVYAGVLGAVRAKAADNTWSRGR